MNILPISILLATSPSCILKSHTYLLTINHDGWTLCYTMYIPVRYRNEYLVQVILAFFDWAIRRTERSWTSTCGYRYCYMLLITILDVKLYPGKLSPSCSWTCLASGSCCCSFSSYNFSRSDTYYSDMLIIQYFQTKIQLKVFHRWVIANR